MTIEEYQKIQELKNEIYQHALLGITAVEMYKRVKYNPEEARKFISNLRFALDKLTTENPELEIKIPITFKSGKPRQIPLQ